MTTGLNKCFLRRLTFHRANENSTRRNIYKLLRIFRYPSYQARIMRDWKPNYIYRFLEARGQAYVTDRLD